MAINHLITMPNDDKNFKRLTPKEWNDKNIALGYKKVNTKYPTVYGVFYDPNKEYQTIDEKTMTVKDLPYITYTDMSTPPPQVDPNYKPTQFGTQNYNPNTGQYTDPVSGKIISPIVEQYKKGGKVKGYATGGSPAFNEQTGTSGYQNALMLANQKRQAQIMPDNVTPSEFAYGQETRAPRNVNINPQTSQAAGNLALGLGTAAYAKAAPNQYNPAYSGVDAGLQSIPVVGSWYGLAKGASNYGRSTLKRDAAGNPRTNTAQAADEFLAPMHENAMDAYRREGASGALKEFFTPAALMRGVSDLSGQASNTTGLWGKINQFSGNTSKQKEIADKTNELYQSQYDKDKLEYDIKKDENDAVFNQYKDSKLAKRNAGITGVIGQYETPNKDLTAPTLQQYDPSLNSNQNPGGVPGAINKGVNKIDSYTGGNNFISSGVQGVKKWFKDGGEIKGKGTGTSDSIKAKVKEGSFIVPAQSAEAGKQALAMIGKNGNAPAENLNDEDGVDIKVSNGEIIFSPEEKDEIVKELGEEFLEHLAPDAEHESDEMRHGGLTAEKAKVILKDGTIRGHKLTDKQRGYFGAIAGGKKCGGMVKGYEKGGTVKEYSNGGDTKKDKTQVKKSSKTPPSDDLMSQKRVKDIQERDALAKQMKDMEVKANDPNNPNRYYYQALMGKNKDRLDMLNSMYGQYVEPAQITKTKNVYATRPKLNTTTIPDVTFTPTQVDDENTVVPDQGTAAKAMASDPNVANTIPTTPDPATFNNVTPATSSGSLQTQKRPFDWGGLGSTILNYGIPAAQAYMGYKSLRDQGPRPVDRMDPTFLANLRQTQDRVNQADINARYGLSSDEKAMLDQQNLIQTNAARAAARNLAGGSAATAFNLERAAANDAYGRSLASKVMDNNLKLQKQQFAAGQQALSNQMSGIKQDYNRMLFGDSMNKFMQKQNANAGLLNQGLSNLVSANRYEQEKRAADQRQKEADNWLVFNGL